MREEIKRTLEELLGEIEISKFAEGWIEDNSASETSIREVYRTLKEYGIEDKCMIKNLHVFGRSLENIKNTYSGLRMLGLEKEQLNKCINLLCRNIENIRERYETLIEFGLDRKKILTSPSLFSGSLNTMKENYQMLTKIGVDLNKARHPSILISNPKKLVENYQVLIEFGLTDKEVASASELLIRSIVGIKKNYSWFRKIGWAGREIAKRAKIVLNYNLNDIKQSYKVLKAIGAKDKYIIYQYHLLWIKGQKIKGRYKELIDIGIKKWEILTNLQILGMKIESVKKNYLELKKFGLSDKLAKTARLLGRNPKTVGENYWELRKIGISEKSLETRPELISLDLKSVREKYLFLKRFGLEDEDIIGRNISLLERNIETTIRNYQHHIGLIREDYKDRNSGRDFVIHRLLATSGRVNKHQKKGKYYCTVSANFQYLNYLGIEPKVYCKRKNIYSLLETKPQTKREKLAWMLRELFDYERLIEEKKKKMIHNLYAFIRKNPYLLSVSIKYLERNKNRLRKTIQDYIF